jgi:heavy metal translocating P-type ATPase
MSGSTNLEGAITIRTSHTAADSQYEQIIKLVKSATASQSPFVRLADRYSIPFTIISFVIAGAAWAVSGDALRFLEVIVVATPCPLLLGAPIALIGGMSRAAKNGIIVKTGSAIERLAEVKTLAFDKTGTLTLGSLSVSKINTFNGHKRDEVLAHAAAIEQRSPHVLAHAIVQLSADESIKPLKVSDVKEIPGHGLSGRVKGRKVLVGRLSLLEEQKIAVPKSAVPVHTATYVAIDGELAGVITFKDEVRPESKKMLERIRLAGVKHSLMVTGDNAAAAQRIADELGIEDVRANCLPADKIEAVRGAAHHPVAFVGDGINDAPVLAASEVGIALGARGATAASESADVVILVDNVDRVASAIEISKRTLYIAKQSIMIGIAISVVLMFVFSTGHFKPVYGAAIQELVDVTVIINALRAHSA